MVTINLATNQTLSSRGEALCSALGCPPSPEAEPEGSSGSTEEPGAGTGHEVQAGTETKLQGQGEPPSPAFWRVAEKHTLHLRIQPAPDAGRLRSEPVLSNQCPSHNCYVPEGSQVQLGGPRRPSSPCPSLVNRSPSSWEPVLLSLTGNAYQEPCHHYRTFCPTGPSA